MSIDRQRLLDTTRMVALSLVVLVVLRLVRGASIEGPELVIFAIGTGLAWYPIRPRWVRADRQRDRR